MMDHKTVEDYVLSMPGARLDYPFGEGAAVYKVNDKMFAIIQEGKDPVSLSLKCDPQLAIVLRDKYETVLEGYHLNKKHWNTLLLTGQLPWEDVQGLIRHSYQLVAKLEGELPTFSLKELSCWFWVFCSTTQIPFNEPALVVCAHAAV
jgi:predicted DNA-binding protein (MmcQ/YjbR family)